MSEVSLHDPFEHLKHKLWPKEGSGVKLAVWFPTTKSRNRPDFLTCKWHATYRWKSLDKGYNFAWDLISIGGLHAKLWAPKVVRVLTRGISGTPTWESQDKMPFGCGIHGEAHSIL
jgi:hypothetical protein